MNFQAFQKLTYGLYIVTSALEGSPAGFIANTVFQVTSDPPQLAVSCSKKNHSLEVILKSRFFSVSVLKKEVDVSLIGEFGFMSGSMFDKFSKVTTRETSEGIPVVIDSGIAWFDCRLKTTFDLGSHILLIGEVTGSELLSNEEPLTYEWYRQKYRLSAPRNAPTYIEKEKLEQSEISNQAWDKSGNAGSADMTRTETEPAIPEPAPKASSTDGFPRPENGGEEDDDEHYICTVCGYIYRPEEGDPSSGIPPGTPFHQLPEDYHCPICNAPKDYFRPLG